MDATDGGMFLTTPLKDMSAELMSESRDALEANLAVTVEGSRAFWNGMRAVGEELGNFVTARVKSQSAFAQGVMSCIVPGAVWAHVAEYLTAEFKAWDDEQSRLVGLFAQAATDTLLEADALKVVQPGR